MNNNHSIFICHNLITVYKTISFIKAHEINNPTIIYYDKSIELPPSIVAMIERNIDFRVCHYNKNAEKSLFRFWNWKASLRTLIRDINMIVGDSISNDLYVFLDHWAIIPSVIQYFDKNKRGNGCISLLEEGLGIYSPYTELNESHLFIKKTIFRILDMSDYTFYTNTIGANPLIQRVYCSDPKKFKSIGKSKANSVLFEGDLINRNRSYEFLSIIGRTDLDDFKIFRDVNYVFLTQPMSWIIPDTKLKELLLEVIEILKETGTILIKKHPRDIMDYSFLNDKQVIICPDDLNVLPFECFYPLVDGARLITFNSSVCNNIVPRRKSVYLYKMLNNEKFTDLCDHIEIDKDKIVIPESIDLFEEIITLTS